MNSPMHRETIHGVRYILLVEKRFEASVDKRSKTARNTMKWRDLLTLSGDITIVIDTWRNIRGNCRDESSSRYI